MVEAFFYPFRHWVFPFTGDLPEMVPLPEWDGWVRYDNDCERFKRTTETYTTPEWQALFAMMGRMACDLEKMTDISPLTADPYGAGLHITDPGGWLQPHLDYAIHPKTGLERRVNLVLFLNREWKDEWGGAFEFYDDAARKCVKRILPMFGKAVVWEAGETAFHGTQDVSKDAEPRVTAACYYLSTPRRGITRKRALFVPRRNTSEASE